MMTKGVCTEMKNAMTAFLTVNMVINLCFNILIFWQHMGTRQNHSQCNFQTSTELKSQFCSSPPIFRGKPPPFFVVNPTSLPQFFLNSHPKNLVPVLPKIFPHPSPIVPPWPCRSPSKPWRRSATPCSVGCCRRCSRWWRRLRRRPPLWPCAASEAMASRSSPVDPVTGGFWP